MMHALDPAKANENTPICDDCLFFELVHFLRFGICSCKSGVCVRYLGEAWIETKISWLVKGRY
jgi:hypothetical protein